MNLFRNPIQRLKQRDGVTLVEVLTSITVAVIGVAGVLILIPFATRQAQVGLALEDSATVAANAEARFQIERYNRVIKLNGEDVLPWVLAPRQPNLPYTDITISQTRYASNDPMVRLNDFRTLTPDMTVPVAPGFYFIDPLWVNQNVDASLTEAVQFQRFYDMFFYIPPHPSSDRYPTSQPFGPINIDFNQNNTNVFTDGNLQNGVPPFLPLFTSLVDSSNPFDIAYAPDFVPNEITQAIAARMFVSSDNLQFGTGTTQNGVVLDRQAPPWQFVDIDATRLADGIDNDGDGTADNPGDELLRRQSLGDVTWSAIAVPRRIADEVDLFDPTNSGQIPDGFDFYVLVYKDRSFQNPSAFVSPTPPPADQDPRFLYANVFTGGAGQVNANGDQIFINQLGDVNIRNDEWIMLINYDLNGVAQLGFYRVIGVIQPTNPATQLPRLLIDGPDFILNDTVTSPSTGMPEQNRTATYAVYLRDVINVYKRQIRIDKSE